ncbi:MAG: ATP-binding cassette domain-containing protein [Lentisphaerae bacterium]|nr:ATP-binding cassette domain-containing protein [Lentisphaerota bacterium]
MICVDQLTKRYAATVAVDRLSFQVQRGEILGILGPNGAGKTTTMRILTGYLTATSGTVSVAGFDNLTQSLEARRRIGYLPENAPLYPEMRVDEYLRFRAVIKGVPRKRCRQRIEEVKGLCGIEEEGRRIIGQLSRGYCQRVGLADCLVHRPEILILDEPTAGLDPSQIRTVRDLIKTLGGQYTVLLSTHILSEAEMICPRVMILNRGRIMAAGMTRELRGALRGTARVVAEIGGPAEAITEALQAVPRVSGVSLEPAAPALPGVRGTTDWHRFFLESDRDADIRDAVYDCVAHHGWRLRELAMERKNLEDVFLEMTGSSLPPGDSE